MKKLSHLQCAGYAKYENYIDRRWSPLTNKTQFFLSQNPANLKDVIGAFPESTEADLAQAIGAAKKAFPVWKKLGLVKRAEYFFKLARLIEDQIDELAWVVCRESGKQINEARADVVEMLHMVQYDFAKSFLGVSGQLFDDEVSEKECMERLRPRGIVGCISPWNFPMAIPLWEIGLALGFGNVVILKPSEETPLCGHKIAELIHQAGFPPGVFQLLQGRGENIGWNLVRHPEVNSILFTGSYEVGAKIKVEVAKHYNKICAIETGSKSAVIILKDAKIDKLAIPAAIASAFKTAGQRCVSAGRIIVAKERYKEVCEKMRAMAKTIKVGDPFDQDVFYGSMINEAGVAKGLAFNAMAKQECFDILLDRNYELTPEMRATGHWLMPFIYTGKWRSSSEALTNEAFSPHVAITPVEDVDEAIHAYNDTRYGLSASVITEDYKKMCHVRDNLECGIFYWNLPCIGAGVRLSFGGLKASGNLIPSAAGILPAITHPQAITYNRGEEIVMAQGLSIKT